MLQYRRSIMLFSMKNSFVNTYLPAWKLVNMRKWILKCYICKYWITAATATHYDLCVFVLRCHNSEVSEPIVPCLLSSFCATLLLWTCNQTNGLPLCICFPTWASQRCLNVSLAPPCLFPAKSISSSLWAQLQTDRSFHPPKRCPALQWNSVTDKSLGGCPWPAHSLMSYP